MGRFTKRIRKLSWLCLGAFFLLFVQQSAWADTGTLTAMNFVVIKGQSGAVGCMPRTVSKKTLRDIVLSANRALDIDPRLAIVLSLDVPPCGDLFYAAVANDVRGIGYQHHNEAEIFDESSDSRLEGVSFLNDVHYWEAYPDELSRAFLHEVGHRWSGRVHVGGESSYALLGRDREHWSYFLDTSSSGGVSPLEGNAWQSDGEQYVTLTHNQEPRFSDLDLYLMGAFSPEEVAPFLLVEPQEGFMSATDCRGALVHPGSPPQNCESVSIHGSAREISIDEVVSEEGPRIPAAVDAVQRWTMAFYFLAPEGVSFNETQCERWAQRVDELRELFESATRDRMTLENVVAGGTDCTELERHLAPAKGSARRRSCAYNSGDAAQSSSGALWFWAVLVGLWMTRRATDSGRRDHKKNLPG
jgi:MYXO-CTERM domain-containing protein